MEQLWKMQKKPGESSKRWSRRAALGENSQAQQSAESLGLDQTKLAQHLFVMIPPSLHSRNVAE
jgi:hypothetical protein